jgi:hypothetical protein
MKTTVIPALNFCVFLTPYFLCGTAFILQTRRSNHLSIIQEQLTHFGDQHPLMGLMCIFIAFSLIKISTHLTIKVHKKRRFLHKQKKHSALITPANWFTKIFVPLSSWICVMFLSHIPAVHNLARDIGRGLYDLANTIIPNYSSLLDSDIGASAHGALCLISAVFLLWLGMFLYSIGRSSKHPPIQASYDIYGKLHSIFELLWTSAKVKGFGIGVKSEGIVGVPEDTVFTETVSSEDWNTGEGSEFTLAFRENFMPHESSMSLSAEHVSAVLGHLNSGLMPNETLTKSNLLTTAKNTAIFLARQEMAIENCPKGLKKEGLSNILRTLLNHKDEDLSQVDPQDVLVQCQKGIKAYDFGGLFNCQLYREMDGNLTPTTKIRENLHKTLDLTTSKDGIGDDYLSKGDFLVALTYNHFEHGDEVSDEDLVQDAKDFGSERNTIVEYKKTWYNILFHGFGRSYMFYHSGSKYIYDEWWVGSLKWFNNPFKKGPKENAIRRIGHVRRAGGPTVAKIEDRQVLLKLFGNYNRRICIYDEKLAQEESFGTMLCLFSQYITYQQEYRELRLQDSLPLSVSYNGGDMDATQA